MFGGIVLNRPVGGINVAAVERLKQVKGGYARVVWMPTFDSENEVRDNPVFTVADGLFWLYQQVERNSIVRKLQVMKLRGQASESSDAATRFRPAALVANVAAPPTGFRHAAPAAPGDSTRTIVCRRARGGCRSVGRGAG